MHKAVRSHGAPQITKQTAVAPRRGVCRPQMPSRGSVARADPSGSGDLELWELHEELLREIEERKQHQARLLDQLNSIQVPGSSANATAARAATMAPPASAPASPSTNAFKPPPPPAHKQLERLRPVAQPAPTAKPPAFAQQVLQPAQQLMAPPPLAPAPLPPVYEPETELVDEGQQDAPPEDPPLAGENVMNIVMVGAECAPWSKTGGLGDVMGALPKAFARRGHRVMVVAPRYENYDNAWETGIRRIFRVCNQDVEVGYFHAYIDGVDFVFVDHSSFHFRAKDIYGGERQEIQFRCALLCKAALEAVWHVPCGGIAYGDNNTVFIANDWHTALLPVYLQVGYYSQCSLQDLWGDGYAAGSSYSAARTTHDFESLQIVHGAAAVQQCSAALCHVLVPCCKQHY
eukprot:GHRR01004067.1.p2 GENE.GHRR01004067.1~~GHRR01004067.1.p2  ORF type:complete len:404 (+),score=126.48 GHRR01004067.1:228-1439(+)